MPRLFTALAVPPDIATALAAYQGGLPGARWIEQGDFHVTLRFLGDVERTMAEDFLDRLGEMRSRAPLTVTLDGLGVFGGGKPRAILATVHPSPEIVDLQDEQERLARRAGLDPETRRFTPHVTLARLRREAHQEAVAMYLSQAPIFTPLTFTADRVTVYSARESTGGGPYLAEAEVPFA